MNGLFQPINPQAGMPQNNMGQPPQFPPQGMPAQQTGMTPEQAQVDAMDALAEQQQKPKYSIGIPLVDKYINMFLGAV